MDPNQRQNRLRELLAGVRLLSTRLTIGQAYEAAERRQIQKYGEPLYRSYASFRVAKVYHKKQNGIR